MECPGAINQWGSQLSRLREGADWRSVGNCVAVKEGVGEFFVSVEVRAWECGGG